jgi:hypothetical protein
LGGAGIRGGQVIGASDFATPTEELTGARLMLDFKRLKRMGRPFDFATGMPSGARPTEFNVADYLNLGSVVNALYRSFGVAERHYRVLDRDGLVAPVLGQLLRA